DLGAVQVSDALEFWDLTNRQDYHVVELQQRGTRSRSWVAGRYSNQEAAVHAFDLMVADRYAQDGQRTQREANTQLERAPRTRRGRAGVSAP
ncbi:MAG TPA: SRPBCC family protein, partial [Candidatus Baltobacteraceae bacterium]|nr:SRPBCC family protein [Candidatus Baltobacteraceae bacterium]